MDLKVIGAGLGRTGTNSLKLALERLTGHPCYHMYEIIDHPEHVASWHDAALGKPVDWDWVMQDYASAVDWPASGYWKELSAHWPDAIILYSRRDPEAWWASASSTIFPRIAKQAGGDRNDWYEMVMATFRKGFTTETHDKEACIRAFLKHEEEVLQTAPKDRLVVWEPGDGWEPLCTALCVAIPDEEFPKVNTRGEFQARVAKIDEEMAAQSG